MGARLVAEEGLLKGLVLPLEEGEEWVIGRDPEACQLLLEDPSASRMHVRCRNTPEGILIENLSQTNPIQINEEELKEPRLLAQGDSVRIGSGMYRFFIDASKVTPKEEPALSFAPEEHDSILGEEGGEGHPMTHVDFALADVGRWLLKVVGGPNSGAEFAMQPQSSYLIGTDPHACDIVFHDNSVSRQHAKITASADGALFIEDLESKNGTLVDGEKIARQSPLPLNTIVTLGTTTFVLYDRDGNMQTIISPLLPSIVKVLQQSDTSIAQEGSPTSVALPDASKAPPLPLPPPKEHTMSAFVFIAIVTGILALGGLGIVSLFHSEPIMVKEEVNPDTLLNNLFSSYPSVKYSFNKSTGRLLLLGHLLTSQDKTQLLNGLNGMAFVKAVDDSSLIIDEYVWQEMNQVLSRNPNWRTITIQAPTAGQFILSGALQTKKQAEQLDEYISTNFPYLDHLEKRIVIEEEIVQNTKDALERQGIYGIQVSFKNGEIILTGSVAANKQEPFNALTDSLRKIPGVRGVRTQINELAPQEAVINISDKYEVSGFSRVGSTINVVINGRIVTKGDILDGMTITEIQPGSILLEKDHVKYRIDFSK